MARARGRPVPPALVRGRVPRVLKYKPRHELSVDFRLRYVHRWEMHHLLELCGFEVLDLYGDFDRSPFDETSAEMVWVAGPLTV